ncbi:MAG: SIMPL domain-containing protein [Pseudomonadota bacterium]|nr:SIMPL domain-containing protein [Pseudomonadota bacterium]
MGSRSNLDLVLSRFIFITTLIFFQHSVFAQSATKAFSLSGAHTLELTGEASLDVVPDELSFLIVIDHTADTMSKAYHHVEQQLGKVLALLADFDLPATHIQAMDFSMTTLYDYQNTSSIKGYTAQRTVSVTLDDLLIYGEMIEALSNAGSYRFEQLQLSSSNYPALEQQALTAAYQNAAEKAKAVLKASNHTLLGLVHFTELNSSNHRPYLARSVSSASDATAFSQGSISISKKIIAHFQFK